MGNDKSRNVAECKHQETITFSSGDVEREVCQKCGHVTLRFEAMISGDIDELAAHRADRTRIR